MKAKGVLVCMALLWAMWGSADPSLNEAPESFSLHCPHDVTVSCDEDLRDLSKFGDAYVWKDYKKQSAGNPVIDDQRNTCGIGVIKRTWRVEDPHWNWHTCTQVITVVGKGTFDENDIIWPQSWTLDTCRANLHPGNLPTAYSYPRFKNKDCAKPAYSYHDEYFEFGPHCAKLIRTWSVIDWCQYKPYPGSREGKWEHIQIIKVDQKTRPTYECPKDTIIYAPDCDSADVVLDDFIAISKCGDTLEVFNNSPFADSSGNNVSGRYPIGEHEVFFMTEYGCGREVKCKFKIKVKSNKPPTPYCKNGIITTLMPMDTNNDQTIDIGMREVWASDLNVGSFHPCYPNTRLIYSFSSDTNDQVITFDCNNIGRNEVEMWVTDEWGNQSYCITYVVVQNNNPNLKDCMPDSLRTGTIAGHLTMHDGQMIEEVEIALFGEDAAFSVTTTNDTITGPGGQVQIIVRHDTSWYDITKKGMAGKGTYAFKDLQQQRNYEVSATKTGGMMNGVDIWDYYAIYFHTMGLFRIQDPVDLIAADLDGNGKVNMLDQNMLISAIYDPSWPDAQFESWRFYDRSGFETYVQSPNAMPGQLMRIANLQGQKMDVDFVGVKIGDLDNSVDPKGLERGQVATRTSDITQVEFLGDGDEVVIRLDRAIRAGQLIVNLLDNIEMINVTSENGQVFFRQLEEGLVQINWVSAQGTDRLTCQMASPTNKALEFAGTHQSYGYIDEGQSTVFVRKVGDARQLELMTVAPNPVQDDLNIYFYSNMADDYRVSVFNANGQLVKEVNLGSFDYGHSRVLLDVEQLPGGSTYYFRLTNSHDCIMGSFIK